MVEVERVLVDGQKSHLYYIGATHSSFLIPSLCFLISLFTLKEASAAIPVRGAWQASRTESRGVARQWEAPGRKPEQSSV